MHTYIHKSTYIHIYIDTYIHIYIHIYTYITDVFNFNILFFNINIPIELNFNIIKKMIYFYVKIILNRTLRMEWI